MKKMKKIVLDSNILLSALVHRKKVFQLVESIPEIYELCFSEELIREVKEKLILKFKAPPTVHARFPALIEASSFWVTHIKIDFPTDPDDAYLLELCDTCKAEYLVTGDKKHLLPLKHWNKTKIINPKEFEDLSSG